MNDLPPPGHPHSPIYLAVLYYWASLFVYGLAMRLFRRPKWLPNEKVLKELTELYYRRAKRVEDALADSSPNLQPLKEEYAFSGWVDLLPDARLKIGGQEFGALGEPFDVTTKDPRNLVRAAVTSNGQGVVLISSHGFLYSANWTGEAWKVLPMDSDQSALPS